MSMLSERKNKAEPATTPKAVIMRTIIATILSVFTATALISFDKTQPQIVPTLVEQRVTAYVEPVEPPVQEPVAEPTVTEPEQVEQKAAAETPAEAVPAPAESTCADEIGKYSSWNQNVAHAIMMAESGGNAAIVNSNVMTNDYSVGCMQVNLLGANIYDKYMLAVSLGYSGVMSVSDLETWLKSPVNNIAVANALYNRAQGWGDWGYTCRTKVACY
jgi:hypothetical protein